MHLMDQYGQSLAFYRGLCNISLEDTEQRFDVTGYFEFAQFTSGRLAVAVTPTSTPKHTRISLRSDTELSFSGEDFNNWQLKTTGHTFFSRVAWLLLPFAAGKPTELTFGAQYIEAVSDGDTSPTYTKAYFLISNMLWHARNTEQPTPIKLDVAGYHISVNPLSDYHDIAERLTHGHGVHPTAWVCIEKPASQPKSLRDFADVMEDIVYLFRLVTGNYVDWYYGEARSSTEDKAVERIHRYTIPTSYSNTLRFKQRRPGIKYLAPKLNFCDLASAYFDESGHGVHTDELKTLINQFINACNDSSSLESSGLLASTLIELIASKRANANQDSDIIPESNYRSQVLPTLKRAIMSTNLSKSEQSSIFSHLQGAYRRSFRQKLQALRDDLDLPLSDCDIALIVRTRNALVHSGTFHSRAEDGGWRSDYDVMIWAGLIALCRLMGYRGQLPERSKGQSIVV